MKKLIFFTPKSLSNIGGGERILSVIANMLSHTFDITIISPYSDNSYFSYSENISIISLGLKKNNNRIRHCFDLLKIPFRLRKYLTGIKNYKLIAFSSLGVMLCSVCGIKKKQLWGWLHTSFFHPDHKCIKFLKNLSIKKCDKLLVLNKLDSELYKEINPSTITVPNPTPFHSEMVSQISNKRLISVGRFNKEKGFDYMIKSCKYIFNKHPDWRLDIYGQDDGEKKQLEQLINSYNLQGNISLHNPKQDLLPEYLNSSVFLFTSLFECFPLVLLEAIECGIPCVVFNSPSGIKDIITDGVNGFLINKGDINEFADKVNQLIEDEILRTHLGNQAKIVSKNFSIEKIEKIWLNILND